MVAQEVISSKVEARPARTPPSDARAAAMAARAPAERMQPMARVDWLHGVITATILLAVVSFELFNFDSTRFALADLLGDVTFVGMSWAVILALAFCSLDFAGLARLFQPSHHSDQPTSAWYLMGAWFLAALMNSMMTWWAVSVRLASSNLGNEVLSHEQLLHYGPIFLAVFVWLTRMMLIGAVSTAGGYIRQRGRPASAAQATADEKRARVVPWTNAPRPASSATSATTRLSEVRRTPAAPAAPAAPRPQPTPES